MLEFWFEFGSTYSYPAAMRVERLARAAGVGLHWKVFLLGPIFRDLGWDDSPFNLQPAKGRYMWRDLERICARHEIPFRRPSQFPRSGLLAARVACCFPDASWLPEFVRSVYRANFAEDLDISAPAIVSRCLACSGEDPAAILREVAAGQGAPARADRGGPAARHLRRSLAAGRRRALLGQRPPGGRTLLGGRAGGRLAWLDKSEGSR